MLIVVLVLLHALAIVVGRSARLRCAFVALALCLRLRAHARGYRRIALPARPAHSPAKPPWVRQEIIRLKALMPHTGCRRIADNFNRRFG